MPDLLPTVTADLADVPINAEVAGMKEAVRLTAPVTDGFHMQVLPPEITETATQPEMREPFARIVSFPVVFTVAMMPIR